MSGLIGGQKMQPLHSCSLLSGMVELTIMQGIRVFNMGDLQQIRKEIIYYSGTM